MAGSLFVPDSHLVLENRAQFDPQIQNGSVKPIFLWHVLLAISPLILALLVPYRGGGRYVRPLLFVATVGLALDIFRSRRMTLGANGYLVGVVCTWWLVWCATLLFFNNVERDFQRIERAKPYRSRKRSSKRDLNSSTRGVDAVMWQPYPQSFAHRLGWTLALALSMRGPDWNWRIPSLPQLPSQLGQGHRASNKTTPHASAKAVVRKSLIRYIISYLVIDVLKFLIAFDPYFVNGESPSAPFSFNHPTAISCFVRFYRIFISALAVYLAIQHVTALNPICFLGLSLAFPNASRALTATPLDAAWLYSRDFGPFVSILDNGLAGAWGQWWHQLFRFGYMSTGRWFISLLPARVSASHHARRAVMILVGFSISGLVHASGSYTQLAETRPVSGTFLFFILQPVGILVQDVFSRAVLPRLFPHPGSVPRWLRRTGNGLFVVVWFWLSGGLIADDFARGGFWLTEPLPFSFIRGLRGEGWRCWRSAWFEYYDDGTFWGSGIRIV